MTIFSHFTTFLLLYFILSMNKGNSYDQKKKTKKTQNQHQQTKKNPNNQNPPHYHSEYYQLTFRRT